MKKKLLSVLLCAVMAFSSARPMYVNAENDFQVFQQDIANGSEVTPTGNLQQDVFVESEELTCSVDDYGMDNDELFEMYVAKQFGMFDNGMQVFSVNNAGQYLEGKNEYIYNYLKSEIKKIANGESNSAEITIKMSDAIGKEIITAEELGLSAVAEWDEEKDNLKMTDEANTRLDAYLDINNTDLNIIHNALLFDCPYELYWYDKTVGVQKVARRACSYDNSEIELADNSVYVFKFTVDPTFRITKEDTYSVDTSKTSAATTAAANARDIVATANSTYTSNLDKLTFYKDKICELVTYDDKAMELKPSGLGTIAPWQLISVFDKDSSTNVVCEGYSKAFAYLCEMTESLRNSEIYVYTVSGKMTGGTGAGDHMWNVAHMDDNKNYLIDVTNCDSGTVGSPSYLFMKGYTAQSGNEYSITIPKHDLVDQPGYYVNESTIRYDYSSETLACYDFATELALSDSDYEESAPPTPTGPVITVTYGSTNKHYGTTDDQHIYDGEAKIYASVDSSDCSEFKYSVVGQEGEYELNSAIENEITVSGGRGVTQVVITAKDSAGNTSTETVEFILYQTPSISLTASTIEYTYNGNELSTDNFTVTNTNESSGEIFYYYKKKNVDENYTTGLPTEVGSYLIMARIGDDDSNYWLSARTDDVDITIAKADVTIAADASITKTLGEADFSLSAKAYLGTDSTNELADVLSYTVTAGTDVVSVNRTTGQVSILKEGTATIQISVAESDNYKSATKDVTITVDPFTFNENQIKYNGTTKKDWYNADDGDVTISADGFTVLDTDAAGATYQDNYTFAYTEDKEYTAHLRFKHTSGQISDVQEVSIKYDRTAPTVGFTASGTVYGSNPSTFDGSATIAVVVTDNISATNTITYSIKTGDSAPVDKGAIASGDSITINEAGKHTVTVQAVDEAGNSDTKSIDVTVYKGITPSITAATGITLTSIPYDGNAIAEGTDFVLNKGGSNGVVTYSYKPSGDGAFTAGLPTNVGTYTIKAAIAEDSTNYYKSAEATAEITIVRVAAVISVADTSITKYVGDSAFNIRATHTGDGTISYSSSNTGVATVDSTGAVTIIGKGTTTLTLSMAATTNYDAATDKTITLTVASIATPSYVYKCATNTSGSTTKKDWYNNADGNVLIAAANYTVSDTINGTYLSEYTLPYSEGTVSQTLYFKDSQGRKTDAVEVSVQYDRIAPAFTDASDGITIETNNFKTLLNTISFGTIFDKNVDVTVAATESGSGIAEYHYYVDKLGSSSVLTEAELNAKAFVKVASTAPSQKVTSTTEDSKYVYYAYVTDKAGNRSAYICSNGLIIDTLAPTLEVKVSDVTDKSAVVNVNAADSGTGVKNIYFVYSTTDLSSAAADAIAVDANIVSNGNKTLSELSRNTTYYYAAVAEDGTSGSHKYSSVVTGSFTTDKGMEPDVKISVSEIDNLAEKIEDALNAETPALVIKAEYTDEKSDIKEEVFAKIKETKTRLILESDEMQWVFDGEDIVEGQINPIKISSDIAQVNTGSGDIITKISNKVKETPTVVVTFPNNGTLPGKAKVRINITPAMKTYLKDVTSVNVYYYKEASDVLETIATGLSLTSDGKVEFDITHCSSYIITAGEPGYEPPANPPANPPQPSNPEQPTPGSGYNYSLWNWLTSGYNYSSSSSVASTSQTTYSVLNGNNQTYSIDSNSVMTIRFSPAVELFNDLEIDGKKVSKKYYTVKSGSTIIEVDPSFMKQLSVGQHTMTANFRNGSIIASFTVDNKAGGVSASSKSPNTGE